MGETENMSLLLVFTGNGKGKTTAALGLAFRALGHGWPVCMIQFIKASRGGGEVRLAERLAPLMQLHVMGRGFTWRSEDREQDIAAAREAWAKALEIIALGRHRLLILDELTYLISYGMIPEREILAGLAGRPADMDIVVTGRDASAGLLERADLVTEMGKIKHPYDSGVRARRGIEY